MIDRVRGASPHPQVGAKEREAGQWCLGLNILENRCHEALGWVGKHGDVTGLAQALLSLDPSWTVPAASRAGGCPCGLLIAVT